MSTALKLSGIYVDLVCKVQKFKNFHNKAVKDNHLESSESSELKSTTSSIKITSFLLFILHLNCFK